MRVLVGEYTDTERKDKVLRVQTDQERFVSFVFLDDEGDVLWTFRTGSSTDVQSIIRQLWAWNRGECLQSSSGVSDG